MVDGPYPQRLQHIFKSEDTSEHKSEDCGEHTCTTDNACQCDMFEFIKQENVNVSIKGYIDFYNVHFDSAYEFCEFFGVEKGNANRDLFEDFSAIFSRYIPSEKVIVKSSEERLLIGRRTEGNNPNAIYCFDVRRNGKKEDGTPNGRSVENSNKAEILRPDLYKRYFSDTNLSFFFSDDPTEERTDREIIESFAKRK